MSDECEPKMSRGDGPEVAVTLVTMGRLAELAPEQRRMVLLMLMILGAEEVERARVLAELGQARTGQEQVADREVALLGEGRAWVERRLSAAVHQLPVQVAQEVLNQVEAFVDGDVDMGTAAAMRSVVMAGDWVTSARRERRRRIVEAARRAGEAAAPADQGSEEVGA